MRSVCIKESGRLDRILRKCEFPDKEWLSRGSWEKLFEFGLIRDSSGRKLSPGQEGKAGNTIQIMFPSESLGLLKAEKALSPIWHNQELALFSKPAGIPSHPLHPWESNSLANRIATWLEESHLLSALQFAELASAPLLEGGLVQRLDRDTSGAILVALQKEKKMELRSLISKQKISKTYLAIVHGKPNFSEQQFSFYTYPENTKKMKASVLQPKKEAQLVQLDATVMSESKDAALVSIKTSHGTRHVVRVCMAALGHPLYGDRMYGVDDLFEAHQLHALSIKILAHENPWPNAPIPQSFLDSLRKLELNYSP